VSRPRWRSSTTRAPARHGHHLDDDDAAPPPPPPAFTVGGTVDGLEGSGLVLVNGTTVLPVTGNGPFAFPGTVPDGSPYDVRVQAQPANPTQVCSVVDGTGTVRADVGTVAVHCARLATPSGLDTTFGTDGIATTSLGGTDDEATDAALLSDGGFVAVGHSDVHGIPDTGFGVARYTADGHPAPGFGASGFVTTDLTGHAHLAQAVAVQPDGKIVAVGEAQTTLIDFDFAVVRYNPDGTLDRTFGGDGTVVGDIGTNFVSGLALTPGGTILVAGSRGGGSTGLDIIVASFAPNGDLNRGFGTLGVAQADLSGSGGFDIGNDLALDSAGEIVVVGSATSATIKDTALVRFRLDGTLDTSLTVDFHGFGDEGNALAVQADGAIVAAGDDGAFEVMRAFL
jgi:uncharacterized delta-60 repeat protein